MSGISAATGPVMASPLEQLADQLGPNQLPYAMPLHPNLVHFTIGLFVIAVVFDLAGALFPLEKRLFRFLALPVTRAGFHDVGWYNLLACAALSFLTVAAGFYEMLLAVPLGEVRSDFGLGSMATMLWHGVGGVIGTIALYHHSFGLFLVGSLLTGIYMSAQGFFRFAAADTASDTYRPKAISYVMAGGLVSAIIGPQLVKLTSDAYVIPFLGTYIVIVGLNAVGALFFLLLDIPTPEKPAADAPRGRSRWELITTPRIAVAVICAMVSYALMNLVMTSTPLAMVGCGFTASNAADVVAAHVLAMFVPSFFTGHLVARFGAERVVALGLVILAVSAAVALRGVELGNFYAALILLGVGWNFGFIGATAMLTSAHTVEERGRIQGLNDLLVFGGVTLASLASGGLMNCSGGSAAEGWSAVNMAMMPFLVLACGALAWLMMRPRSDEVPAE
jgi:uncharacterized membrane protein